MSANPNHSVAYYPSAGEKMNSYVDRLNTSLAQLEEWSSSHITWWTHRSQGSCWICDLLLLNRILCDVMKDVCSELKQKQNFIAEHPKGSTNPDYFSFRMHART